MTRVRDIFNAAPSICSLAGVRIKIYDGIVEKINRAPVYVRSTPGERFSNMFWQIRSVQLVSISPKYVRDERMRAVVMEGGRKQFVS